MTISPYYVCLRNYVGHAEVIKSEVDVLIIALEYRNVPKIEEVIVLSGRADIVARGCASLAARREDGNRLANNTKGRGYTSNV